MSSKTIPIKNIQLKNDILACRKCEADLPQAPRPILQWHPHAKILITGQAPGRLAHEKRLPFDDPSGNRLREWLGVSREVFYNEQLVALVPMAFCYPGTGKSGDFPPPKICAQTWRSKLLEQLGQVELTLVLGQYAHKSQFGSSPLTLTDRVKRWQETWPNVVPLPHPSPRNNIWLKRNPWFEEELLPALKAHVKKII